MARDEKLLIRLDEKMKFMFQKYADRYGVTMSAMGAIVIGQWVDAQVQRDIAQEKMLESAAHAVQTKVDEPISDAQFDAVKSAAPEFIKMLETMFASEISKAKA